MTLHTIVIISVQINRSAILYLLMSIILFKIAYVYRWQKKKKEKKKQLNRLEFSKIMYTKQKTITLIMSSNNIATAPILKINPSSSVLIFFTVYGWIPRTSIDRSHA